MGVFGTMNHILSSMSKVAISTWRIALVFHSLVSIILFFGVTFVVPTVKHCPSMFLCTEGPTLVGKVIADLALISLLGIHYGVFRSATKEKL